MIQIAAAVEQNRFDAFRFCALGNELADCLGCGDIAAGLEIFLRIGVQRRCGRQRRPQGIVDDLRVNVLVAPEYAQPGTIFRTGQVLANSLMNSQPDDVGAQLCHATFLPPFRPSSSSAHSYTGCPFVCRDPAFSMNEYWRPPAQPAGDPPL